MNGKDLYNQLKNDVREYVSNIMDEYHHKMPLYFYNDIIADVMECSAYYEGYYSVSDIKIAFERIIAEKFGIEI